MNSLHLTGSIKLLLYKSATPLKLHKAVMPGTKIFFSLSFLILFFCCDDILAQPIEVIYSKDTKAINRERLYKNLLNNSISRNLSLFLTDSTEENWIDAFSAMELIRYKSPWAENRIATAFEGIGKRSIDFQQALLELLYANYQSNFLKDVEQLLNTTGNDKIFALCAEYLQQAGGVIKKHIATKAMMKLMADTTSAILKQLNYRLNNGQNMQWPSVKELL